MMLISSLEKLLILMVVLTRTNIPSKKGVLLMKKIAAIAVLFLILVMGSQISYAQSDIKARLKAMKPKDYPSQPIEFVVVYAAGGTLDLAARFIAKYVEQYADCRCIVVNKTGGGGLIGHTYLATQAKTDGYTVGILATGFLQDEITKSNGKWSYRNLDPLSFITFDNVTWIVRTDGPLKDKSAKEIIAMAKQTPDKLKVGVVPEMTFQFLIEDIEMISGAKFIAVPFQGAAPSVVSLLGGHIDMTTAFFGEYRSQFEAGKVRAVGAAGTERSPYLPDVPTFNEILGVNHILWSTWRFAAVPKGTPVERVKFLEAAIDAALHDPECIKEFDKMGMKVGPKYMNAIQTADELKKIYENYKQFFTKTGRISK
jgi:tripartite-type tricarboxylate transporter receptor subunit TctC